MPELTFSQKIEQLRGVLRNRVRDPRVAAMGFAPTLEAVDSALESLVGVNRELARAVLEIHDRTVTPGASKPLSAATLRHVRAIAEEAA